MAWQHTLSRFDKSKLIPVPEESESEDLEAGGRNMPEEALAPEEEEQLDRAMPPTTVTILESEADGTEEESVGMDPETSTTIPVDLVDYQHVAAALQKQGATMESILLKMINRLDQFPMFITVDPVKSQLILQIETSYLLTYTSHVTPVLFRCLHELNKECEAGEKEEPLQKKGTNKNPVRKCPFCGKLDGKPIRHIMTWHNKSQEEAKRAVAEAKMATESSSSSGRKTNRPLKFCTVCKTSTVERMDKHLRSGIHSMSVGSADYQYLLKNQQKALIPAEKEVEEASVADQLATKFAKWLASIDGKNRAPSTCSQKRQQLLVVFSYLKNTSTTLDKLDLDLVHDLFVEVHRNEVGSATMASYCDTVRDYMRYQHQRKEMTDEERSVAVSRLEAWASTFRREASKQKAKEAEEISELKITVEDVVRLEKSKNFEEARRELERARAAAGPGATDRPKYFLVRDYVAVSFVLSSACRAGVIGGVSVADLIKCAESEADDHGYRTITVDDHKTVETHGVFHIPVTEDLLVELETFRRVFRPLLDPKEKAESLLLTWSPSPGPLQPGSISRILTKWMRQAGVEKKVTTTDFRSLVTGEIWENAPDLRFRLARLLCHRMSTAQRYYAVTSRKRNANTMGPVLARTRQGKLQKYRCPSCWKTCSSWYNVRRHSKTAHKRELPPSIASMEAKRAEIVD